MGARNVEEPKKSKIKKIKLDDIELINLDEETKKKKRQKKGEDDEEKIKLDGEVLKKNYERIRRKEENNKELFENLDPTVIDFVIQKLKEIVETLNVRTPKEKAVLLKLVFEKYEMLNDCNLSVTQAKDLYLLLEHDNIKALCQVSRGKNNPIKEMVENQKEKVLDKLIEAVNLEIQNVGNIEELEKLCEGLPIEILRKNNDKYKKYTEKINQKKSGLSKEKILAELEIVPENIIEIVRQLANGNLDVSSAARVIEKEAIENVKKADYDDFDEGVKIEKKKIHTQIKSILVEKAKDYCIKNPTLTVLNLKELTGDTLIESISSIIMNLVERKEYDKALEMCKFFEQKTKDDEINKYIEKIRTVIVNMEIGNMIIKGINIGDDKEIRERYFDTISKGLNQKGISLDEIPLGEITKDGTKMTLADIYYVSDKYTDKEREV